MYSGHTRKNPLCIWELKECSISESTDLIHKKNKRPLLLVAVYGTVHNSKRSGRQCQSAGGILDIQIQILYG